MILWRIVDTVTSSDARTKAPSFLTLQVIACLGRKDLVFPPHEQYRYRLSYRDCSEEEEHGRQRNQVDGGALASMIILGM